MNAPFASTGSRVLDDVAEVIGIDAATALARRFGGQRIYVPRDMGEHHPIAVAVGLDAARLLAEFYQTTELFIPIRARHVSLVHELARLDPPPTRAQIADRVGITERQVYRLLANDDQRQGDLFD